MSIAKRCNKITPFIVMEVLDEIHKMEKQGMDIIHMEIGEPDFDVPNCVKKACEQALKDNKTHYTHSLGDIKLRSAISLYHKKKYNTDINPDNIVVTSGTSSGMLLLFSALLNPKDEVIISDPHYACYANFINYVQGVPVTVPVFENNGFLYTPEAIKEKITSKTKAILINSPSNPTGMLIPEKRMKQIVDIAKDNNLYIISDEIYHGLVYEEKENSIYEFYDKAFVLNGFSKFFAMTGLRLGYVIAPAKFVRAMQILQQNFFICANSISQQAGIVALEQGAKDTLVMQKTYNKRRVYIIKRLRQMGFNISFEPLGAFYLFVNAKHISNDSYSLAFDILKKAHVGVTPGIDFGANGEGYLRFSYANCIENLKIGLDRIQIYLENL